MDLLLTLISTVFFVSLEVIFKPHFLVGLLFVVLMLVVGICIMIVAKKRPIK